MTMHITVTPLPGSVVVEVKDDTGRDQTKVIPRYPLPGSELYVKWVDLLDMMMYGEEYAEKSSLKPGP